jgi:hypothetical protein
MRRRGTLARTWVEDSSAGSGPRHNNRLRMSWLGLQWGNRSNFGFGQTLCFVGGEWYGKIKRSQGKKFDAEVCDVVAMNWCK